MRCFTCRSPINDQRSTINGRISHVTRALLLLFVTLSLSAAPIAIAPGPNVPDIAYAHGRPIVSAAASGSQFLVAWEDRSWTFRPEYGTVRYRTYGADGTPEQSLPRSMPGQNAPSVDWNGAE